MALYATSFMHRHAWKPLPIILLSIWLLVTFWCRYFVCHFHFSPRYCCNIGHSDRRCAIWWIIHRRYRCWWAHTHWLPSVLTDISPFYGRCDRASPNGKWNLILFSICAIWCLYCFIAAAVNSKLNGGGGGCIGCIAYFVFGLQMEITRRVILISWNQIPLWSYIVLNVWASTELQCISNVNGYRTCDMPLT